MTKHTHEQAMTAERHRHVAELASVEHRTLSLMQQQVSLLREQLDQERHRSAELTTTIVNMKLAGGTPTQPIPPSTGQSMEMPKARRSSIDQAIDENPYASSDPALRRHLANWADAQLANGEDEDKVEHILRTWSNPTGDEDEDDEDDTLVADDVADGVTGDEERSE